MNDATVSPRAQEIERQFRAMPMTGAFDLAQERQNTKDAHVLTGVPEDVLMEWDTIAGVRCIRMRPRNARPDREVIFLHGGAYCLMSAMTHHRFGGHIANAACADVIIPDYVLAPEAPYPQARDDCMRIYEERRTHGPAQQILAGDSAGGGLVLSVACAMRNAGIVGPDALIMMSPWLDLSMSGPLLQAGKIEDPILSIHNLTALADLYRGSIPAADPGASPLFADLSGLPRTLLQISEKDLLREDGERLAKRWPDPATLTVQTYAGMLHSFQMFAGDMPEADAAIAEITTFLDSS